MKKVVLSIFVLGFWVNFLFGQVAELSTEPNNATTLTIADDYEVYQLNPTSNVELTELDSYRSYFDQNYYLTFTMPENADVGLEMKFPANSAAGLVAYVQNDGQWEVADLTYMHSSPGVFIINQSEVQAGNDVKIRVWFDNDLSGQVVQIDLGVLDLTYQYRSLAVLMDVYEVTELADSVLISGCLEAENTTFTGDPQSIGYFTCGENDFYENSGITDGVILTSGDATKAVGPDDATSAGLNNSGTSDPDLAMLCTSTINDACILEFDFIPASDHFSFEYIFGSEEFPEYANSTFNDVFGFFLSGPGINGPYSNSSINIAVLPNGDPVSINNVYNNPEYYVGPTSGSGGTGDAYNNLIQYDGASILLTAEADVIACETYHIKIAVADAGDGSFDTGVFLMGDTFESGELFVAETFNPWLLNDIIYEGCSSMIIFTKNDSSEIDLDIPVIFSFLGDATNGDDYTFIPDTFYIAAGQMSDTLVLEYLADGIVEGVELATYAFTNGCPCSLDSTFVTYQIFDELEWVPTLEVTSPICLGETATITMVPPDDVDMNMVDWVWEYDGSDGFSIEVTPTETTEFGLDWTYPCTTEEVNVTIEVVEPPVVDLGADQEIMGYSYGLNANMVAGNTGEWTQISGPGTATFDDPSSSATDVTVSELGIYEFQWEEFSLPPSCVDADIIQIEFFHVPTAEFTISTPLCFGENVTVTFIGEAYEWATFSWNFGSASIVSGSGQGPYVINLANAGIYEFSLTVEEMGYVATETNFIMMPELLEQTLTSQDVTCYNGCNGSAQSIAIGGTTPYNYSWSSGNSTEENLCAGSFTLTVTDANGCFVSENFVINQPPMLQKSLSLEHVECFAEASGSAELQVSGGTAPYSYIWSNESTSPSIHNVVAGNYDVEITDAHGCIESEMFTITEPAELSLQFIGDMQVCEGDPIPIEASAAGGTSPYVFYWNIDGTYIPGPSAQLLPPDNPTQFISVYAQDEYGCTTPIQAMELVVSPQIILTSVINDNTCHGACDGRAEIFVEGGIPPFTYSWESDTKIWENMCAGVYDVTVTDQIGCNENIIIQINEPPALHAEVYSTEATCVGLENGTAWTEAQGGIPPYTYLWGDGETTDNIEGGVGIYDITVSDVHDCRVELNVEIVAPTVMQLVPSVPSEICISEEATLSVEVLGGTAPYDFYWEGDDSTGYHDNYFVVSPIEDTHYYLTVTDDHGCQVYFDFDLGVKPPLSINSLTINRDTVCSGEPVNLYIDADGGDGGPYTLSLNNEEIIPSPYVIYPQESGWYYIVLDDNCATPYDVDSVYIHVWPTPENNFVSDAVSGCPPMDITFTEFHEDNNYEYIWNYGDGGFGFLQNPTHIYTDEGKFSVTLTIKSQNGCKKTHVIENMIEIYPTPSVDFIATPSETSILTPDIQFDAINDGATFLYWYFGDGDSATNSAVSPVHYYPAVGEYDVQLIGVNLYGCADTAFKNVKISDEPSFYAPTGFSPNGDGINDCFKICGNSIDANQFNLVIFDRWGMKVFETDEFEGAEECDQCGDGAWFGTVNNDPNLSSDMLPAGVYIWYCVYLDEFGNQHELSGEITLIQ